MPLIPPAALASNLPAENLSSTALVLRDPSCEGQPQPGMNGWHVLVGVAGGVTPDGGGRMNRTGR